MSRSFKKRLLSSLLALMMVLELVPLTALHAHAADMGDDDTDLSIDFDYISEYATAEEALKAVAEDYSSTEDDLSFEDAEKANKNNWVKIMDGDLKVTGGKFREAMESSDPDEKYIVLSQDVDLRNEKEEWHPIEVKSDKVLDLAGFTLAWIDETNKDPKTGEQSTYVKDHYKDKVFIHVREGATLTIIDSSMPVNGKDTVLGTGKMVADGKMLDAFKEQIDHYTQRDLFLVDGNLVIYGGTFEAGRQKDQWKDNFSWAKLGTAIGNTITLGVSIAEYATGITGAEAVLDDVNRNILKSEPDEENDSEGSETATGDTATSKPTGQGGTQNATVQTPASAGANGDPSKNRAQTVGERTATANANDGANKPGGSGSGSGGTTPAPAARSLMRAADTGSSGSGTGTGSSGSGSGTGTGGSGSGTGTGGSGSGTGTGGSGSGSGGGNGKNTGSSAAQTDGENTANAQGTAKEEWVKDKHSQIAEAEKGVVNAWLDKDKLMDMYDKTATVISNIASMIGSEEGTRITHTIHGTVAQVNTTGTLVVYNGLLKGHGASEHTRNATIEVTRLGAFHEYDETKKKNEGGRAYIFGGTVEAYAGANCFNMVRYNAEIKVMARQYALKCVQLNDSNHDNHNDYWAPIDMALLEQYEGAGYVTEEQLKEAAFKEYTLPLSETNELEVLHYENQKQVQEDESVKPIPIDTSNIVVRGGTFRCYYELYNVGVRFRNMKTQDPKGDQWTFLKVTGTSGSVNLGLESFGEDMIRDGRIQLNDVYGDGSLVLMDEEVDAAHPAGLKHYRLYCGDTELRHIRYLDVYPMNAGANSTHSFALQTYYGDSNLMNISTWNNENDDENMHTAPFAGDEYFFDYEFDGRQREDIYVTPNLDGGVYGEGMRYSEAWYYPDPVDHNGNPIPDISTEFVYARVPDYDNGDGFFTPYMAAPTHYMKDLHILKEGNDDDYEDYWASFYHSVTNEKYRHNMKWFRYRVYRVDPITRENINENLMPTGDDPLLEVVYGVAEDDAMKCKISLEQIRKAIEKKLREEGKLGKDEEWSYQTGELYRIVLNVDEHVNYGYTGEDVFTSSGRAIMFDYDQDDYGNDWSEKQTFEWNSESYTGVMPVASTESTILFRCVSTDERAKREEADESSTAYYEPDYTPLQFDTYAVRAGEDATINFRNAKVSQADNEGTDFIDVYYQWYLSDDEVIDRDPADPNRNTDELLAGITNICTDWSVKYLHQPENWNPDADIYDYRNSLAPDDPNYEAYGEDGLHDNPDYWSMKELHAYTTELRQNSLCTLDPNKTLSMANNNPFAFNTDSCYIPKDAAGKYLYVKAVVVNAKDEYTKIYDRKQVFYSHPMLIIDPSMLKAETQEPEFDLAFTSQVHNGVFYSWLSKKNLGQDAFYGFTGIALPESMDREFETRLTQEIVNETTGEVLYKADNGEMVNLKEYVTEQGLYNVKQTQTLYYLKPYYHKSNNYEKALVTEEYVTSRTDIFPVQVSLPMSYSANYSISQKYFAVGDELTFTAREPAEAPPAGIEYWYKWVLYYEGQDRNNGTVLQDSASNILHYPVLDDTPFAIALCMYSKDAEGNESLKNSWYDPDFMYPCEGMNYTFSVNGTEIECVEDEWGAITCEDIYLEKGKDASFKLEVSGGKGDIVCTVNGKDKTEGETTRIAEIDTSTVGKTSWIIRFGDDLTAKRIDLDVYVCEPLSVTEQSEDNVTTNYYNDVELWVEYIGIDADVEFQKYDSGSWVDVDFETDEIGGNKYNRKHRVSMEFTDKTAGTYDYRAVITDRFGNEEEVRWTVTRDDYSAPEVAAGGRGKVVFFEEGSNTKNAVFNEGDVIQSHFEGGFNYDGNDLMYLQARNEALEMYGRQEVDPVADFVQLHISLYRMSSPEDSIYDSTTERIYQATYLTFNTEDGLPVERMDLNTLAGEPLTPGYYYMTYYVRNESQGAYDAGIDLGTLNYFTMAGTFEVLAEGEEHEHNHYQLHSDYDGHWYACFCGDTTEVEDHCDYYHDVDEAWSEIQVSDWTNGEYVYYWSGIEQNSCGVCRQSLYRWRYVDTFTAESALELAPNEAASMNAQMTFVEQVTQEYFEKSGDDGRDYIMEPSNDTILWISSDPDVAVVDKNGKVTAIGEGTATITGTAVQPDANGNYKTVECEVTVACDHSDVAMVAATESDCTNPGYEDHYKCLICNAVSLDGTFTDGIELSDIALPLVYHEALGVWSYDATGHFRTCKYGCGTVIGAVELHTFNVEAADCVNSKYCTKCKYEAEAKHGHSMAFMAATDADCDDAGKEAHYWCFDCGKNYLDADGMLEVTEAQLVIPALGHKWDEATCTAPKTCSRAGCGATEGTALGHAWTPATCESPKTCSRCELTTGSALGHTWTPATCESPKTCSVCGKTEGARLPHTTTGTATCTEDLVCSVCHSVVQAATGHTFVDGECVYCGTPGSNVHVEAVGTIAYSVSGNTISVSHDKACKVGYLVDGKYVAVAAAANSGGGYDFTVPTGAENVIVVVSGDTNGDGKLSMADATRAKFAYNGKLTLTAAQAFAADANNSASLTMADATRIKFAYNGKLTLGW